MYLTPGKDISPQNNKKTCQCHLSQHDKKHETAAHEYYKPMRLHNAAMHELAKQEYDELSRMSHTKSHPVEQTLTSDKIAPKRAPHQKCIAQATETTPTAVHLSLQTSCAENLG